MPEPVWCAASAGWAGQQPPHTSIAQATFGSTPPRKDAQAMRITAYRRMKDRLGLSTPSWTSCHRMAHLSSVGIISGKIAEWPMVAAPASCRPRALILARAPQQPLRERRPLR